MSHIAHQYFIRTSWNLYFEIYLFFCTNKVRKNHHQFCHFRHGVELTSWCLLLDKEFMQHHYSVFANIIYVYWTKSPSDNTKLMCEVLSDPCSDAAIWILPCKSISLQWQQYSVVHVIVPHSSSLNITMHLTAFHWTLLFCCLWPVRSEAAAASYRAMSQPVLCTLYSVLCTLYSVFCTLYSVLCTLYSLLGLRQHFIAIILSCLNTEILSNDLNEY